MIQKIRELLNVKKEIEGVSACIAENSRLVKLQSEEIQSLRKESDLLRNSHNLLAQKISEDCLDVARGNEDFQRELADFKLMKSRLERRLLDSMEQEMKEQLLPRFSRLDSHIKEFEQMSNANRSLISDIASLGNEIGKFITISQHIKAEDFELTRVEQRMHSQENEKIELLRRIDSLERLVAKLRHQQK